MLDSAPAAYALGPDPFGVNISTAPGSWVAAAGYSPSSANPDIMVKDRRMDVAPTGRQRRMMMDEKDRKEEFRVNGEELIAKIKELVHEGNIRHLAIVNEDGKTLIDVPLTVGVVGALVAPQLAALGAIAALVGHCTVVVEKSD
jgi:CBS domain-containing protein